ncbi:MAG: nucleotidyltransferase family protein [Candidatus Bathyarchaeota archaeon]|nr:nucleotidyltransferase family protein [Candidatus Bathyarchaeota archaeon]
MKSLTDMKAQLEELKPILRKRFQVETIGIFGSYSRKEQKKNSDIDLLVTFVEPNDIDLVDFIEIKQFLERKLKMKVDLVTRSALKPLIRDRILEETIYV